MSRSYHRHASLDTLFPDAALADNPLTGIAREDLRPEGLRSVVHGSHVVFYQPQPYGVLIVRVLHGWQDVRTHLGGGEEP
jgi:plasmid stabilization system protein ParE